MNGEDWTEYTFQPAPRTLLCQFRREGQPVYVGYAKDFPPEFNVAGLEWKLTGIAREQLDRMPEEVGRQVMPEASWLTTSFVTSLMSACGLISGADGVGL